MGAVEHIRRRLGGRCTSFRTTLRGYASAARITVAKLVGIGIQDLAHAEVALRLPCNARPDHQPSPMAQHTAPSCRTGLKDSHLISGRDARRA